MIPLLADRGRSEMMGRLLACLQVQDCFAYLCLMAFCISPHFRENSTSVAAAAASTHPSTHPLGNVFGYLFNVQLVLRR